MGLDVFSTRVLVRAGISGVVATIGRQALFGDNSDYASLLGISVDEFASIRAESDGLCEGLLRHLGAASSDSLDLSAYEGATILHDLNEAIPTHLKERFDVVIDGGSLEHVFNYPAALRNVMEMVKPGGKLIIITPANNQCGHGLYQISPELMYRSLSAENGYRIQDIFLRSGESDVIGLKDPASDGKRREITTSEPTLMYVVALREAAVPLFRKWPQQSDYVAIWND